MIISRCMIRMWEKRKWRQLVLQMHWQPSMKLQSLITHRGTTIINRVQCEYLTYSASCTSHIVPRAHLTYSASCTSHVQCLVHIPRTVPRAHLMYSASCTSHVQCLVHISRTVPHAHLMYSTSCLTM